jgi:uncharacterized membrane protein YagU involved in acid resistance|tara:strand:- start:1505 stop:1885 length:381 start_codon:yes stop_codon:yes gene_type:complete
MVENKYITEKEIDYLKHLQEHNMFNYNVKLTWLFGISSITISILLSMAILIVTLYYNLSYLNQNFSNGILLVCVLFIIAFLPLSASVYYLKIKGDRKNIQKGFKKYHTKIKERYKEIGLDIDSLNK